MAHVLTDGEKTTQRTGRQWSKTRIAIPEAHTIYSARLAALPTSNDMVAEITVDRESGTRANVLPDMTLLVGTTAGAYDLGMCRIRKTPIAGTFYIAETSEVVWQVDVSCLADAAYLTVVDDYQIWAKSLRIVSEVPYLDWDIAYSNQHATFDPVPGMGSDKVAKLVNGTIDVILGPSADVPAWVIGSTIASRLWTISGAVSIDDNTATNPIATFDQAGTYLAYCLFTAANGKTFTGVRYIVVWDDNHLPIGDLQISNGKINPETGACSFDVDLYSGFDVTTLRKRSKVILFTEDFAENQAVVMPGQIEGSENILCEGWISDIDTSRVSEYGQISFTVESAEFWMKKIRDYPVGLEFSTGAATAWTEMPLLNVDRALWHMLHWRSTATRIMDILPTNDTRYATRFQVARANLWERMEQITGPTIFAHPGMDNFGRLFIQIDPQMVPLADRTWPVVMTITDDDIEGEIRWKRRDVNQLSMLFFSGIAVSATGDPSSYFSMSPGHSYGHFGDKEPQDNYLVEDQANSNALCGLYYGWRNNDPYDLEMDFIHSMRILGCYPRQYFHYSVSAADDPRGLGFEKDFIVREISFNQEVETGLIKFSSLLEPASIPGPSINGDVPTMEDIDFSYPNINFDYPPLLFPLSIPYTYPDPSETTDDLPKKIVIATTLGVIYTTNADEYDPLNPLAVKWQFMNNGLDSNDLSQIAQMVVTPGGVLYIMTNGSPATGWEKIMRASSLGGLWITVFTPTDRVYDGASRSVRIVGLGVNRYSNDQIGIVDSVEYITGAGLDTGRFYVGSTSFGSGNSIATHDNNLECAVVFEAGKWFVFFTSPRNAGGGESGSQTRPWLNRHSASGAGEASVDMTTGAGQGLGHYHGQAAAGKLYLWVNGGNNAGYYIALPDLSYTYYASGTYSMDPEGSQGMAVSPDGTVAMGAHVTGPYTPKLSTDSLATWSSLAGTIPIGSDVWESTRNNYGALFGGGSTGPRFTPDRGSNYIELGGTLSQIAASRDITHIRFLE